VVHVAHRLGLAGTVRNLASGCVEAIAEGDEVQLNNFIDELREGPSTARVSEVQVAWSEPEGRASSFIAVS
jgi:acylphosphatase